MIGMPHPARRGPVPVGGYRSKHQLLTYPFEDDMSEIGIKHLDLQVFNCKLPRFSEFSLARTASVPSQCERCDIFRGKVSAACANYVSKFVMNGHLARLKYLSCPKDAAGHA